MYAEIHIDSFYGADALAAHHLLQMTETLVKAVGLREAKPNLQILAVS
jgi:hypothetical protein